MASSIRVPSPNKALDAVLTGKTGNLQSVLLTESEKAKALYQATVGKKTGRLMQSAHAFVEMREVVKGQHRLVGLVEVGGTLPVAKWYSKRNPNPGKEFYYGVFHEFGNHYIHTVTEGGGSLSVGQKRRLEGLERLAVDRAASPSEKALARQRADDLKAKMGPSRTKTTRVRKHPAAKDLEKVIREMSTR
jgi:hypothetical protein